MNLSEYSNYDGLGLAQLVKNKDLSAADANSCTSVKSFQFAIEFSTNDALYRTQR